MFKLLTPPQVKARWIEISNLLNKAVIHGRGELAVDDILDLVTSGRMFVAITETDGKIVLAIAAEIMYYPRKRVLNLAFGAGIVSPMYDEIYTALAEMAKVLEADAIQCYCRKSVAKLLMKAYDGVEEAYIVVEKKVDK